MGAVLGLVLAGCAPGGGAGSDGGGGGEEGGGVIPEGGTAAWLETSRPNLDAFVLRGTIPVPRGVYPRSDGKIPFRVHDYDGTAVPTQVEIVSRYPNDAHGADVVEVLARVRPDPDIEPGAQARYRVSVEATDGYRNPGSPGLEDLVLGTKEIPAPIWDLLSNPTSIRISAFDCFGNEYTCYPLDGTGTPVLMRYGPNLTELRVYQTMEAVQPDPGPEGTLPHLFGVHSYLSTYRGEEVLGLDVRFNNAHGGSDPTSPLDDPLDEVYFERIEIGLPSTMVLQQAAADPYFGSPYDAGGETVYPLVAPLGDGTMHVIRWQGQFHRRLMISTPPGTWPARSYLDGRGRGFVTRGSDPTEGYDYYSWWNTATARYFTQSFQLPSLDHVGRGTMRDQVAWEFQRIRGILASGTSEGIYPFESEVLGWGHPYGVPYGGMTGGSEIWMTEGLPTAASASVFGIPYYQALHRMQMDRMPLALYSIDGEPSTVDDWLRTNGEGEPYVPFEHFIVPVLEPNDPFGFDQAPRFQIDYVVASGRQPDYYGTHTRYDPYDYQHFVRFTRGAKALAWLANDSIAKDDLRMAAEMFNLSFHPYLNGYYGGIQGSGLRGKMELVAQIPAKGFPFGRGEAWGLDCAVAAFATSPPAWRDRKRPWFDIILRTLSDGQAECSGFLQAQVAPKFLDGKYHARQGIEQSITENALRGLLKTVYEGADPAGQALCEDVLEASLYAFISKMAWFPGERAPWSHTAVGPQDKWLPIYCQWTDLPADGHTTYFENFQNWSSFAYAFELTGDSEFLLKAAEERGDGDLLWNLEQDGLANIGNRASLLALLQRLYGEL